MTALALDTATEVLSVALKTEEGLAETTIVAGMKASEYLMPAIDGLVGLARVPRRFDLVVCMRGPGSFTGLRIGMATAKGLAAGSGGSLVAVPTLEAIAFGLSFFDGVVVPVIDARKHRLYAALFQGGKRLTDDMDIPPSGLAAAIEAYDRVLLTGPAAPLFAESLRGRSGWTIDPGYRAGHAGSLIRLGLDRFERYGGEPDDTGPTYLRSSEAELPAQQGELHG